MNLLSSNPFIQASTNSLGRPGFYIYRIQLILNPHHQNYILCVVHCPYWFNVLDPHYLPSTALGVRTGFLPTHVQNNPLRSVIVLSRSIRTGVIAESTSSDHCSRLGVLGIPALMLSTDYHYDALTIMMPSYIVTS